MKKRRREEEKEKKGAENVPAEVTKQRRKKN